jgi:2-dehydro-3-deoxygluconokinase
VTAGAIGAIGEGLVELGCEAGDAVGDLRCGFGGDVANTAVMAARTGVDARLCARVGDDALGRRLLGFWERAGVDLTAVRIDPDGPTGVYVNERLAGGGHRFDYHRAGSAGSRLVPTDVSPGFLDGIAVLHYSGVTMFISPGAAGAARAAAEGARALGARVSFAVNHRPRLCPSTSELAAAARRADIVFVSDEESRAVFATDKPAALAAMLSPVDELIVTAGGAGATVHWSGEACRVPAPDVPVLDAAGAGDALAGAYLAARIGGSEPPEALRCGVAAASLSCGAPGCALSYPDAAAVAELAGALP